MVTLTTTEAQALYRWLYRSPMPRGPDYLAYQKAMDKLEAEMKPQTPDPRSKNVP